MQKACFVGSQRLYIKNIEPLQLLTAIRTILSGKNFYSNEIALKLLEASQKDEVNIVKK